MEEQVKAHIEEYIGNKIENSADDLIDSGLLDSLEAMSLLVSLESKFNVKFSFAEYSQQGFLCLNKLVAVISEKGKV